MFGMENMTDLALVAISGALVGLLSGAFGVGGGFLVFPVLTIAVGLPTEIAVGCAACQALGPATTALQVRRLKWQELELPLIISGGVLVGVFSGASALRWAVHSETASISADQLTNVIYAIILWSIGGFALIESLRSERFRPLTTDWLARIRIPPIVPIEGLPKGVSLPVLCLWGTAVGFQSGLLGNSGGILVLPGLVYFFGFPTQKAVAASLAVVWMVSLKSTAVHAWLGHVDLAIVVTLLIGGTIGAQLGSSWSRKLRSSQVRLRFSWLLIATACVMTLRSLRWI